MKTKYKGIDERTIKCASKEPNSIESGISFDELEDGTTILRFHYLDYIHLNKIGEDSNIILTQKTKIMHLDKEAKEQLIQALSDAQYNKQT